MDMGGIAGVIITTERDKQKEVLAGLEAFSQFTYETESPKGELIGVLEEANLNALQAACREIEDLPGVLGVYPSLVTTEDEIDNG